jgi:dethiobiotin synthetase
MPICFITSCGTGRGKTYVSEKLISDWRVAGETVDVLKPVISGFEMKAAAESDTGLLLKAAGYDVTEEAIYRTSPWRYKAPLSPDMAAAREGQAVPVDEIISFCRGRIADAKRLDGSLLIEGAGGVMVPLDEHRTMRDLMAALDIPVILVVGSYLGSLSHTLTAIEALKRAEIGVERLIVNEGTDSNISLSDTRYALQRFIGGIPIKTLEFKASSP